MEYLFVSFLFSRGVYVSDKILRTNVFQHTKFWWFHLVVAILTLITDTYSASRPIVIYDDAYILGLRILNVPVENLLFGFGLVSLNIILF